MNSRMNITCDRKPCYDIVFSADFDDLITELSGFHIAERKVAVITDTNVKELYGEQIMALLDGNCKKSVLYAFEAGEEHKTLDTVKDIYRFLIEEKFDRKDLLLALGGGVTGDITGYTAATYLRGIDFIQIPTTLLAQADSSIGGKTGVDFEGYKNMVGAFYMPKLVYMNVSTLKTLSDRQFYSGFAEIMKHGLIKDAVFYEWLLDHMYEICDREPETLLEMVEKSSLIKKLVVEKDPTEKGDRALLNFGHTIGHAIESAYGLNTYLHGECVAMGMLFFIEDETLKQRVLNIYKKLDLPQVPDYDSATLLEYVTHDKKSSHNTVSTILVKQSGSYIIKELSFKEIQEVLERGPYEK